ncbi:putative gustatory receptor 28a [Monomorium pharaonis]|uniref:putative gustatory receptor 28a n=1 Tax=Monomorium pharaonis TaxID=307658 RepID=UPI00063EE985|nr:putative gustatory receptor 28a [Monomorium pharaonis]
MIIVSYTTSANMFNSSSTFKEIKGIRKEKIWQLFRATDFESLMYPCFTFSRFLGIHPYKINASIIKTCKFCYILSTIIICAFCVFEVLILYDINVTDNILFKNIPRKLERNCFYIFGGFITIVTFIQSGPRMRLLQTILQLSLILPPKSYQNLSRLIHAKDIFGFFFLIMQGWMYFPKVQFGILRQIFAIYISLLVFEVDMLYMNCVCVLKACFKQINDNLANLQKIMAKREPYVLKETHQRNLLLLIKLNAVKKQHMIISDTVQMLKIVFNLQLFSTMIITFTQIIFNLYYYLMQIQVGINVQKIEFYYGYLIAVIIYYFTKVLLMVWSCETGKNQAAEIITTVHEVLNSASDKQIKYELQLFSLQLMHYRNIFSAKGLTVNATFFTAMMGSITMYLLILVQFLLMFNICAGKSRINVMI